MGDGTLRVVSLKVLPALNKLFILNNLCRCLEKCFELLTFPMLGPDIFFLKIIHSIDNIVYLTVFSLLLIFFHRYLQLKMFGLGILYAKSLFTLSIGIVVGLLLNMWERLKLT